MGKTIDAIRNNDVLFLSKVVDDTGIFMGSDAPAMSAVRFRKELSEKRGAYCVIFDTVCPKGGFVTSPTASSLRQILIAQPVDMKVRAQGLEAKSEVMSVEVKKAANPNETLFTLWFRKAQDRWKLQHIEYF